MKREKITVLCSGISLGVYVPGVLMGYQLNSRGGDAEVVAFENILLEKTRQNIPKTKIAFHRNFQLALMAQKVAGKTNYDTSFDPNLIANLLTKWKNEGRKRFIAISGFWIPILEQYIEEIEESGFQDVTVDLCHMDSAYSPSWKMYSTTHPAFRVIRPMNSDTNSVDYSIRITEDEPLPYTQRTDRFLIHGGGWGVGTYQSKIPELVARGIKLDVIVYEERDLQNRFPGNRYFMIDPAWKPWEKDATGRHQFPPFGEVTDSGEVTFQNNPAYPEVYDLIQHSRAIISKPGGSTLLDSLSSATPLLLLEPYGGHEKKNGQLWQSLGFAIPYQEWINADCSLTLLEKLHTNLLNARANIPNYITEYMENCYAQNVS